MIEAKYGGYIDRQVEQIERFRRLEDKPIPGDLDYGAIPQLRAEAREKFERVRPRSLGQAGGSAASTRPTSPPCSSTSSAAAHCQPETPESSQARTPVACSPLAGDHPNTGKPGRPLRVVSFLRARILRHSRSRERQPRLTENRIRCLFDKSTSSANFRAITDRTTAKDFLFSHDETRKPGATVTLKTHVERGPQQTSSPNHLD